MMAAAPISFAQPTLIFVRGSARSFSEELTVAEVRYG
jgi:hypothetical protein